MLRALLDANVLISAALRPSGPPGQIMIALFSRQAFHLVLSPLIVSEVRAAFEQARIRRYLREPEVAPRWLADVVAVADLVKDAGAVRGVCRDPADDMVLSAAREGRANVIVTGDLDLLTLRAHEEIAILSPRTFLDLLQA